MTSGLTSAARELLRGAAVAATLVIACSAAGAQQKNQGPPNALQGFAQNRDQPVKIEAASLEVREKDKIATFNGDVLVVNGDTELRCKSLQVFYDEEPSGKEPGGKGPASKGARAASEGPGQQIKRIEAKGGVTVVQKDQHATGESAIFNMRENTVMLIGNVIVTRGQDVIRGPRLMVNLATGVSKIDGAGGRVDVLIVPKSSEKK